MELVTTVYPGDDQPALAAHFFAHYRRHGVRRFHVLLMQNAAAPTSAAMEALLGAPDVRLTRFAEPVRDEQARVDLYSAYKREVLAAERLVVAVDLDELVGSLGEIYERACSGGYDYVRGRLFDRFTEGGRTAEVEASPDLFRQFPVCTHFSWEALGALTTKTPLARPEVAYTIGLHKVVEPERWRRPPWDAPVAHFKWTAGIIQKIRDRLARNAGDQRFVPSGYVRECQWLLEHHVADDDHVRLDEVGAWFQPHE